MPPQQTHPDATRKLRSDARRNRERVLEAARAAFTRQGAEASLEEIARRAGVGAGTLYRHFPTRDALIEAVFRDHVDKLTLAGERYAATMEPLEALRQWTFTFIEYVESKLLILPAMNSVPGGSTRMIEGSRSEVHGMFHSLVDRAKQAGTLRAEIDPDDLFRAFVGIFQTTAQPGWEASARRIVGILLDGARTPPAARQERATAASGIKPARPLPPAHPHGGPS